MTDRYTLLSRKILEQILKNNMPYAFSDDITKVALEIQEQFRMIRKNKWVLKFD